MEGKQREKRRGKNSGGKKSGGKKGRKKGRKIGGRNADGEMQVRVCVTVEERGENDFVGGRSKGTAV
jgi:hypothetical protein